MKVTQWCVFLLIQLVRGRRDGVGSPGFKSWTDDRLYWGYRGFTQFLLAIFQGSPSNMVTTAFIHILSTSVFINRYHLTLQSQQLTAALNKQ
jgi:hypothetical protein